MQAQNPTTKTTIETSCCSALSRWEVRVKVNLKNILPYRAQRDISIVMFIRGSVNASLLSLIKISPRPLSNFYISPKNPLISSSLVLKVVTSLAIVLPSFWPVTSNAAIFCHFSRLFSSSFTKTWFDSKG